MAICEVCGNDYDMSFEVVTAGITHTFDSFECAIHKLAPICEHCARAEGALDIVDNAAHASR